MDLENKEKEFQEHYNKIRGKSRLSCKYEDPEEKMERMETSTKEKEKLERDLRTARCDLAVIRKSLGKAYDNNIKCILMNQMVYKIF